MCQTCRDMHAKCTWAQAHKATQLSYFSCYHAYQSKVMISCTIQVRTRYDKWRIHQSMSMLQVYIPWTRKCTFPELYIHPHKQAHILEKSWYPLCCLLCYFESQLVSSFGLQSHAEVVHKASSQNGNVSASSSGGDPWASLKRETKKNKRMKKVKAYVQWMGKEWKVMRISTGCVRGVQMVVQNVSGKTGQVGWEAIGKVA